MRKLATLGAVVAALAAAGGASADGTSTVGVYGCFVNGGSPIDASGLYDAPMVRDPDGWVSFASVPTGVVLAPGESATLSFTLAVSHRVTDGLVFANGDSGKPLFFEPGAITYSCT